jgi:hypothetical protein
MCDFSDDPLLLYAYSNILAAAGIARISQLSSSCHEAGGIQSIRFRQAIRRTVHHSTNHTCRATLVHLNRAGRLVGPALYSLQPHCTQHSFVHHEAVAQGEGMGLLYWRNVSAWNVWFQFNNIRLVIYQQQQQLELPKFRSWAAPARDRRVIYSIRFRQAVRTVHHSTNHNCRATVIHLNQAGRPFGPAIYGLQPLCTPPLLCVHPDAVAQGEGMGLPDPAWNVLFQCRRSVVYVSNIPAAAAAGIARSSQLSSSCHGAGFQSIRFRQAVYGQSQYKSHLPGHFSSI